MTVCTNPTALPSHSASETDRAGYRCDPAPAHQPHPSAERPTHPAGPPRGVRSPGASAHGTIHCGDGGGVDEDGRRRRDGAARWLAREGEVVLGPATHVPRGLYLYTDQRGPFWPPQNGKSVSRQRGERTYVSFARRKLMAISRARFTCFSLIPAIRAISRCLIPSRIMASTTVARRASNSASSSR